ncbi:unnamed protein product [Heterobilharzia americana]|nr:unnamed protein product [Heterobilharzia americana]
MQKRRKSNSKRKPISENSDEKISEVYCVCRSSDIDRFMIACDQCEEWYHGDCINVTPKQAEQIKTFYCPQCRCKNPSLEIEYKNTRSQKPKQSRQGSSPNSSSNTYVDQPSPAKPSKGKRGSPDALINNQVGPRKTPVDRSSQLSSRDLRKFNSSGLNISPALSASSGLPEPLSSGPYNRGYWAPEEQSEPADDHNPMPRSVPNKNGCSVKEDCGKCEYCRDRRKFGGPNKMRQKCRLRQCAGMNASRSRNPSNSSQGIGARRRKQPPVQTAPADSSPAHMQSYTDFDDEQFEVPFDFSPRLYSDTVTQPFLSHSTSSAPMGSKMRRGDHRIPTVPSDIDGITSRHFGRFGHDGPQLHSRNKGSISNIYPINTDGSIDFVEDNDSDDDIVLPEMAHCAGPACMLAALPGEKYCSESCRLKHTGSRGTVRPGIPNIRSGISSLASREANAIPYSLPYPDHMYCRHHRLQNWQNNITSSYRYYNITNDNLRQSYGQSTYRYSHSLPIHRITPQRHFNSHPILMNSNHRINNNNSLVEDNRNEHTMICDGGAGDTTEFIDSITSVIRRNNHHHYNGVFNDELCIDLPSTHPSSIGTHLSSTSPSLLSGINSCYTGSNRGDTTIRPIEFHPIDDDNRNGLTEDDDDDDDDVDHPVYGYYMIGYNNETNGHSSHIPLTTSTTTTTITSTSTTTVTPILNNECRLINTACLHSSNMNIRSINHRVINQSNNINESINSIPILYTNNRSLSISNINHRHTNINLLPVSESTGGGGGGGDVGSSISNSSIITPHSLPTYIPGPDEFYTINDSDDLEINWPQETVTGVNG